MKQEPASWLSVAVRIVIDWRFAVVVAVILKVLLHR